MGYNSPTTETLNKELDKITLNCNLEKILDILIRFEKNKEDLDKIYRLLYVLVEKEKYLQNKYDYKSLLIEKLSDNNKEVLTKMFYDRMMNYYENHRQEEAPKVIDYLTTVDREYEMYFDKLKFENRLWFYLDVKNYKIVDNSIVFYKGRFGVIHQEKYLAHDDDKVIKFKGAYQINDNDFYDPEYIWVSNYNALLTKERYTLVNKQTGEIINCPFKGYKTMDAPRRVLNFILVANSKKGYRDIYNMNYEKLSEGITDYKVDYAKGYLILSYINDPDLYIYDRDFKLIHKVNRDKLGRNYYVAIFNDGVVSLEDFDNYYYKDLFTAETIYSFKKKSIISTTFAYSEGLFNYIDEKTGFHGYKDLDGKIKISPTLERSAPFLSNVAIVNSPDKKIGRWALDKKGQRYSLNEVVKELFGGSMSAYDRGYNFLGYPDIKYFYSKQFIYELDFTKHMYRICTPTYNNTANIIGNSWYMANDDTLLQDIVYNVGNEKVLKKE